MSKDRKLILVMNGKGGVGKDTLCDGLRASFDVRNVSSITPIKEIAAQFGWNGEKDERSRRFLADLKKAFSDYNDLPTQYLLAQAKEFSQTEEDILCCHIREPDQIARFVKQVSLPCLTVLVRRATVDGTEAFGNRADDSVEDYAYDLIFDNDAPVAESCASFCRCIREIFERHA